MRKGHFGFMVLLLGIGTAGHADEDERTLRNVDVFAMEWALDPRISPDARRIVYLRQELDIMHDRLRTSLWTVNADGGEHRPLLADTGSYSSPRFSPDGTRLAYLATADGRGTELHLYWLDTGQSAVLSNLPYAPGGISWSPDGEYIAFQMFVATEAPVLATPPPKPEGAQWAPPVTVIADYPYRRDGPGYLTAGHTHLFVIPAQGGTPRQLTRGDFDHAGRFAWSPDGETIAFSANRVDDKDPLESEIWTVGVNSGELNQLTDRNGPDFAPLYSPDGRYLAYLGFDDRGSSTDIAHAYLLDTTSGEVRDLTPDLDRSIDALEWAARANNLHVSYDDRGKRVLATLNPRGGITPLVDDLGSASVGRPYTSGSFSVADNGVVAYTRGSARRPSEVGVIMRRGGPRTLTALNEDLFAQRDAAPVEEIVWASSVGDYTLQGWLVKPPGFDPDRRYPLILEIHGGPHTAYGPHFSPEIQLFAAAGYVVLYTNPRGSTSYGFAFANEIHQNYPGQDYDDLISGVDAAIAKGYIDERQLFVTGGSGGGVLTAWIVGKTDRFRAAAVQKPVINWVSTLLTTDIAGIMSPYWFARWPWEDIGEYWRRSPLSLVGTVTTPTMLITGEEDFRTPMPESEQYFQALKLRGVDTALVRVPERGHNLVARPSHLIAKADSILAWFARYRRTE